MEKKHGNTILFFLSLCLGILTWNVRIKGFLSFLFYFNVVFIYVSKKWKAWTKTRVNNSNCEHVKQSLDYIERSAKVCKEDVLLVMEKLGMNTELCDDDDDDDDDRIEEFGVKNIWELFDDEDVNLSEVEQAFDVFDQNKDGFIEARELLRVLSCLGLGKDLMECQEMINAVDQNGDELIDRNEFVRIMEQCFG